MGVSPATPDAITVVVADRHALIRRALRDLIHPEPGFAVVAQVAEPARIPPELAEHRPDVLLVEPELLGDTGLMRLPTILTPSPVTRALVLTNEATPALERHAALHGAAGLLVKHAAPDELFAALRRAVGGFGPPHPRPAGA